MDSIPSRSLAWIAQTKNPASRALYLRKAKSVYFAECPKAELLVDVKATKTLRRVLCVVPWWEHLEKETGLSRATILSSVSMLDALHTSVSAWLASDKGPLASLAHMVKLSKLPAATQLDVMARIQAKACRTLSQAIDLVTGVKVPTVLEQDFQAAAMVAMQLLFGARCIVERRNRGQVVTRDRTGKAIGVFKASQVPGAADVIVWLPWGVGMQVEFKAADETLKPDQIQFANRMRFVTGTPTCVTCMYNASLSMDVNASQAAEAVKAAYLTVLSDWKALS